VNRAFFLRVLLSLLLLVTQQMGASHAMSHWAGADATAQSRDGATHKPSKVFADDQGCAQCLAHAQVSSAIASPVHAMPALALASYDPLAPSHVSDCARTVCVFQSRAPPQA
jgi:hypothetical protein